MTDNDDRYYKKEVYVCRNCGDMWNTPGAAELCSKQDEVLSLVDQINDHKQYALDGVIEELEEYVQEENDE